MKPTGVLGVLVLMAAVQGGLDAQSTARSFISNVIPGVIAVNQPVELVAQGLRGSEGPVALPDGRVLFTQDDANEVTSIELDGTLKPYLTDSDGANGLIQDARGRLVVTQPTKRALTVLSPRREVLVSSFEGRPLNAPNDLVADRNGGIYFTDPRPGRAAAQEAGIPAVYYLSQTGVLTRITEDIERPNGIILSGDEQVLFVSNTLGREIIAFDLVSPGEATNRRSFATLAGVTTTGATLNSGAGGMTVDTSGHLYVASRIGVQVFSSSGMFLGTISFVEGAPQNVAFGGRDRRTLYMLGRGYIWKVKTEVGGLAMRTK